MFPGGCANHRPKVVFCGIDIDAQLQALLQDREAELIAVSHTSELDRNIDESDWGCIVAGDWVADQGELQTLTRFVGERPAFAWLVWSSLLDWPAAIGAMQLGAFHVLRRPQDDAKLAASLEAAVRLSRERFLVWQAGCGLRRQYDELSTSEKHVLALVMKGWTNKEIGLHVDLSLRTVESRRQRIFRVMQTENATTLAGLLARHGMLDEIVSCVDIQPAESHSASA
jgi:FixJ family two-component response regulator